jgi:hypothetical protein
LYTEFDEMKYGIEIDKQVLYRGKKRSRTSTRQSPKTSRHVH